MKDYQHKFIELAISKQALTFGKFTWNQVELAPTFNIKINNASSLELLADCYSQTLKHTNWEFDTIMGLAYKGIPLVSATSILMIKNMDVILTMHLIVNKQNLW